MGNEKRFSDGLIINFVISVTLFLIFFFYLRLETYLVFTDHQQVNCIIR